MSGFYARNYQRILAAAGSSPRRPHHDHEAQEQIAVARWITLNYPDALWTSSAAGMHTTNKVAAAKMKAMGARAGVPDLMIFEPRAGWHGLFIELKRSRKFGSSRPEESQLEWQRKALDRGYMSSICYGADEAMNEIDKYMRRQFNG